MNVYKPELFVHSIKIEVILYLKASGIVRKSWWDLSDAWERVEFWFLKKQGSANFAKRDLLNWLKGYGNIRSRKSFGKLDIKNNVLLFTTYPGQLVDWRFVGLSLILSDSHCVGVSERS